MGKKSDTKSVKGGPASSTNRNEDSSTPEPYNCTGNFPDDFAELWHRTCQGKDFAPLIKARGQLPTPEDNKTLVTQEEENEGGEAPPTTFKLIISNLFFVPSIQCEFDPCDTKNKQVEQIFIRGWKVEEKLITVLKSCSLDKLTTINLWHTGLTDHTFKVLVNFLPTLSNLKSISIEGNPIDTEPFGELISKDIPIQHLSLRNNKITDVGSAKIGKTLGSAKTPCPELLNLNLAFNDISDEGAKHIAEGLRMNRNLISLSLASNKISDIGAQALASSLQWITLTHDEIIQRRKVMSENGLTRTLSASTSQLSTSRGRRSSERSIATVDKKNKIGSPKKKQDTTKSKNNDGKGKKESLKTSSKLSVPEPKGKNRRSPGKERKRGNLLEVDSPDIIEQNNNPLLDSRISHKHEKVYAPGCFTLVCLNISRNLIGEEGMKSFLQTIKHQIRQKDRNMLSPTGPGLLKLSLQGNKVPQNNEVFYEIFQLMTERNPLKSPDCEIEFIVG